MVLTVAMLGSRGVFKRWAVARVRRLSHGMLLLEEINAVFIAPSFPREKLLQMSKTVYSEVSSCAV